MAVGCVMTNSSWTGAGLYDPDKLCQHSVPDQVVVLCPSFWCSGSKMFQATAYSQLLLCAVITGNTWSMGHFNSSL